MNTPIKGTCHCKLVEFELNGDPKLVVNCHCDDCKKRNGSAYSTYMAVQQNELNIVKGADSITGYTIENVGEKHFCANCGTPIYNNNYRYPGLYMVFYGAVNSDGNLTPSFNVFCENKHKWVDTISDIQSFQGSIER